MIIKKIMMIMIVILVILSSLSGIESELEIITLNYMKQNKKDT